MAAAYLKHPERVRAPRKKRSRPVRVTDHALVRWLNRVEGVDMEFYRRQIAETCSKAALAGATRLKSSGCEYIILEGSVVTVLREGAR